MFTNCFNEGFQMTFQNGLTISVQWSSVNYCENRNFHSVRDVHKRRELYQSSNAEIAILNDKNEWYDFGTDTVEGWVSTDEVADWIFATKNATSLSDIKIKLN